MRQLDSPTVDLSIAELYPVNLSIATMKEITGEWLVKIADYISSKPHFIVNGFLHSGISETLDSEAIEDLPLLDINDLDANDNETSSGNSDESDDEDNVVIDYIVL